MLFQFPFLLLKLNNQHISTGQAVCATKAFYFTYAGYFTIVLIKKYPWKGGNSSKSWLPT